MNVFENPIEIIWPAEWRRPFLFSSPHSGRVYPKHFVADSRLSSTELRQSEDFMVDCLFAKAPAFGAPLLTANFPRAYCDVNREAFELDPHMFKTHLPSFVTTNSPRLACGIGTIPKVVGAGKEIYRGKLDYTEIRQRIEHCYFPYHHALRQLIDEGIKRFGIIYLVDCHSMPAVKRDNGRSPGRADIILGNRYGTTCNQSHLRTMINSLESLGYSVGQNSPYAGGYITSHYGNPEKKVQAVQIEINRSLYMDQETMTTTAGFGELKKNMSSFIGDIVQRDSSLMSA